MDFLSEMKIKTGFNRVQVKICVGQFTGNSRQRRAEATDWY